MKQQTGVTGMNLKGSERMGRMNTSALMALMDLMGESPICSEKGRKCSRRVLSEDIRPAVDASAEKSKQKSQKARHALTLGLYSSSP